jgi:hypothetical protein
MGKKELKKQYQDLEISFVDIISNLDTTPTKKFTPFLIKQFNQWIQYDKSDIEGDNYDNGVSNRLGKPKNELEEIVKKMVFQWAEPKLGIIEEFTDHMENNRLVEKDVNNYENWSSIKLAINDADIKQGVRDNKNKTEILHNDEEWLILKPLSMEASINYGYGTKWCTSMKSSFTYFHKYSKDGVLIFAINRKNGIKYAFYSSPKEYSVWTASDARIDSMETTIPFDLLVKMKVWTNFDKVGPNYNYFEELDKHDSPNKKSRILDRVTRTLQDITGNRTAERVETRDNATNGINRANLEPQVEMSEPMREEMDEEMNEEMVMPELMAEGLREEEYYGQEDNGSITNTNTRFNRSYDDDEMVGLGHSVHGTLTDSGERTWSEPYPDGPGGGFDTSEEESFAIVDSEMYNAGVNTLNEETDLGVNTLQNLTTNNEG